MNDLMNTRAYAINGFDDEINNEEQDNLFTDVLDDFTSKALGPKKKKKKQR